MRASMNTGALMGRGILRLRAALRMTFLVGIALLAVFAANASGTTYYVSSSTGNDSNTGTSSSTAWQTIAHVNGQTFEAGDSILFKRGDVWNESLTPPSSGSSGNPIKFDAYGTGAAPSLTGYYAVPSTAWVLVTGNAWKARVPSTFSTINFCLFGSVWGQKVSAVSSNLTGQGNFYLANGYVYVYSQGNPANFYNEPIVPMALSNVPVININGQSWLTFQHFLINWFDQYGVYVQGTSDHLVFANMEADSMIPEGTQPLGFYVDENAPGPGAIEIYNTEAHLNYDGYRFDGTATAISMVNDKAYANRDGALVDNTGAVTYSYCHFYASSLALADSTDVEYTSGTGPIAGAGNVGIDTPPAVQVYKRYPAEVTLTVDDSGMTAGADSYYATQVLPVADAAGVPVGAAITVGYPLANTLISEFQRWINAGRDVTSHSMSHTYYTNTDALDIQYNGTGTAASLSISDKLLTITVTGAGDSVSYNLAQGQPQGTILGLKQALLATGKFTTSYFTPCQGPYGTGCSAYTGQALLTQDLADVSGQDVETAVYHLQLDVTRLTTDEITLSRQWMTTNLTGLPATPVYVYPGGYETTTMQGITASVPYGGARGALKEDLGVKDTYADGFNVQNVTSFGVNPSWMGVSGVTPAILNQKIQALVWKESVWGAPWGIFWHLNELTQDDPVGGMEITNLINDFKNSGATIRTNTGLVNWLLSGQQETGTDGNDYYTFPATSMALDFRPTKNSPVVNAGQNLGAAYELDINGVNQNSYGSGWEIGAHVYQGYAAYGGEAGGSHFTVGEGEAGQGATCAFATGALGGVEATCANPNLTAPTIMCATLDGSTPSSNGSGTGCSHGFALAPVALGGTEYPGYFNFNQSSAVKVITEVGGQPDSFVAYYNETVPTQTISADHFGMQCGPGESTDCPIVSGVVTWPNSIATPKVFRIHDSGQGWSSIEPTCAAYSGSLCISPNYNWSTFDAYLDAIANHAEVGMVQMLSPPCWTQASCNVADPVYPNGGTAPPTDLGTGPMGSSPNFNSFITAWVSHVSPNGNSVTSNIKVFQLWNEWDLCQHWTGTAAQLYSLLAYPAWILRANIPGIIITTPSEQYEGTNCQDSYSADLATWLNLENTNGRISDVVDWHGYLTLTNSTTNIPETQWATYQSNYLSAQAAIAGWNSAPFFNSETNFDAGNGYVCPSSQYTEADCAGQMVRWQILHDSNGGVGLDWYYWNTTIGQTSGSTASGYFGFSTAYYYAQQYLIGGHFTAAAALSSGTTWTAPFIESNGTVATWVWSTSESGASYTVPSGYTDYRDLNGGLTGLTSGESIAISVMPIMLEQGVTSFTLTNSVFGTGSVTITAPGYAPLTCVATGTYQACQASYASGTTVTLTATSTGGLLWNFSGFTDFAGDGCGGPGSPVTTTSCLITLTGNKTVFTGFEHTYANFERSGSTAPLDLLQLNLALGQTTTSCAAGTTQSNAYGCLPQLGGVRGAGTCYIQPATGAKVCRGSDGYTEPNATTTQEWLNIQGGSEQNNTFDLCDQYVAWGRDGYGVNNILPFPMARADFGYGTTATHPLWPGSGSNKAYGFNTVSFSRTVCGLFFSVSVGGQMAAFNTGNDPAVVADSPYGTPGSTPTQVSVTGGTSSPTANLPLIDFTDTDTTITNAQFPNLCFNATSGGGRWSGSGEPFNPLEETVGLVSDQDLAYSLIMSSVRNGCYNPANAIIDWSPSTTYTTGSSPTCGAVACGTAAAVPNHPKPTILPMHGNAAGYVFQPAATCTSGSTEPSSWPQNTTSTVTDGSCTWQAVGQAANWGNNASSGAGIIANSCSDQDYATLLVKFQLNTGLGENQGDCDVVDSMNGHSYHNGADQGLYQWYDGSGGCYASSSGACAAGTTWHQGPLLFTIHDGGGQPDPRYGNESPYTCVGSVNSSGVPVYSPSACPTPQIDGTDSAPLEVGFYGSGVNAMYSQFNGGHTTLGFTELFQEGNTTPEFTISPFANPNAQTVSDYLLPLSSAAPTRSTCPLPTPSLGPPPTGYMTGYACGNYNQFAANFPPGLHATKNYHPLPLSDAGPVFLNTYNPTAGYNGFDQPFADPTVNEFQAYMTDGSYNYPLRFFQNQISGEGNFYARYGSFLVSQSGNYACWTTDGMNTFGGTTLSGQYTGSGANTTDPTSGPNWQPNTAYSASDIILPLLNNPPYNDSTNSCTYQVVTPGTSGATAPAWQAIAGECSDSSITIASSDGTTTVTSSLNPGVGATIVITGGPDAGTYGPISTSMSTGFTFSGSLGSCSSSCGTATAQITDGTVIWQATQNSASRFDMVCGKLEE